MVFLLGRERGIAWELLPARGKEDWGGQITIGKNTHHDSRGDETDMHFVED